MWIHFHFNISVFSTCKILRYVFRWSLFIHLSTSNFITYVINLVSGFCEHNIIKIISVKIKIITIQDLQIMTGSQERLWNSKIGETWECAEVHPIVPRYYNILKNSPNILCFIFNVTWYRITENLAMAK